MLVAENTGAPLIVGPEMVGDVPKTSAPLPVSSVHAVAMFAEENVPSAAATPLPSAVSPVPPFESGSAVVSAEARFAPLGCDPGSKTGDRRPYSQVCDRIVEAADRLVRQRLGERRRDERIVSSEQR